MLVVRVACLLPGRRDPSMQNPARWSATRGRSLIAFRPTGTRLHSRVLGYIHAPTFVIKKYATVYQRENGVVTAHAHTLAGVELSAALAYDNVAGYHRLTTEFFYAEPLAARVASVSYRALSFFMCHV